MIAGSQKLSSGKVRFDLFPVRETRKKIRDV